MEIHRFQDCQQFLIPELIQSVLDLGINSAILIQIDITPRYGMIQVAFHILDQSYKSQAVLHGIFRCSQDTMPDLVLCYWKNRPGISVRKILILEPNLSSVIHLATIVFSMLKTLSGITILCRNSPLNV